MIKDTQNGEKVCKCKTTDGLEGTCMPYTYCFHEYDDMTSLQMNTCLRDIGRPTGVMGVCCPVRGLSRRPKLPNSRQLSTKCLTLYFNIN